MPAPKDNATSVYVTESLNENAIWQLAALNVEPSRGPIEARGDLLATDIASANLKLARDDQPERHAAILGWPEDKEEVIEKAQTLAAVARLVVR
jgi:hypothetical protein